MGTSISYLKGGKVKLYVFYTKHGVFVYREDQTGNNRDLGGLRKIKDFKEALKMGLLDDAVKFKRNGLDKLLEKLTSGQLKKFNYIFKDMPELTEEHLSSAIRLVERTIKKNKEEEG